MSKHLRTRTKSVGAKTRRIGGSTVSSFHKGLLLDEAAIETAIDGLQLNIADPTTVDLDELIGEIGHVPHLLEFILSAVDDHTFCVLRDWILESFPHRPEMFEGSTAFQLLGRFSLAFLFLPSLPPTDTDTLTRYRRDVELAAPVLKALSTLSFPDDTLGDDDFDIHILPTKRQSQKQRKHLMRTSRTSAIDSRPFINYGVDIPTSKTDATDLAAEVLEEQMDILKYYLDTIRNPELAPVFKNAYLPPATSQVTTEISQAASQSTADSQVIESASETSGAYPFVQPLKAALYFDSAKGFGQWRILISTRADQDLRQYRKRNPKTFKIIVNKIKDLSNGHFSDDNQKRLTGIEIGVPIYEAKMTGDTRLVYQVDCVPEFESDVERQVLRIFGIYTHGQMGRRIWEGMSWHVGRRGPEHIRRCTYREAANDGGDVFLPGSWPPEAPQMQSADGYSSMPNLVKEDLEEMHSLLVLEKFVTFSQALLNSILADQEVAHVHDVSPQEKRIIEHTSSCYVLGRSGTGKTTTMLFKMLGIERSWENFRDTLPKPRQLFVTQSRVLAEKVEEYFGKLLESLSTAHHSSAELASLASKRRTRQEQGLVDQDEEVLHRGDLPKRYGALMDEHFPMFLTYDQICRLLESEFAHMQEECEKYNAVQRAIDEALEHGNGVNASRGDGLWSSEGILKHMYSYLSYATFLREYWPHFPQALTKGLDPTLVFAEFLGVIKRSEQALEQPQGYLDQESYRNLSVRTQGTFANQRDAIYRLFQVYLRRKRQRGDWDAADRTHALIRSLRRTGVPGQEVDFLYVDEAQDNLLIDALVLRSLCRNPHGLFWAGDTAQTISAGSAFRFNDLKAFLHRVEEKITGASEEAAARRVKPESFQLAVNYRSHAGIVNCAHTVIELITSFWPYAIDSLAEEKGMIDGLKPVFFAGWDQDTVRYEQFLFGESGSHIEFGAQQCILVRDEAARDRLRAQVGEIGLILTLYEAKGLEFNDVLLYNFFEDSTADLSQWRVVLNALEDKASTAHAPRFDDVRHNGICRELKFLYVAITRARKNLWIADSSEKGEPMRTLWTKKDQIQVCTPGTDVPQLAMSSTPEEWAATARTLFNNRRYSQAMHCYERAGLPREKAVAHAYYLREQARSAPANPRDGTAPSRADAYSTAALAFMSSAQDAITEKSVYYRIAAECYVQIGDHVHAAEAYEAATEYDQAAQHYRRAGKFDEAVKVIESHKEAMDPDVVEKLIDVARLYFLREQDLDKALDLFETADEALEYMEDSGLEIARATLLERRGEYAKAAELLFEEGKTLEAVRLLLLDRSDKNSVERAVDFILSGFWSVVSLGVVVTDELLRKHPTIPRLLELAQQIDSEAGVDENALDELAMFQAICSGSLAALVKLVSSFMRRQNHTCTLLCLDHVFSKPLELSSSSLNQVATTLDTFLLYVRLLRTLCFDSQPSDNPRIRKLFGLRPSTEDTFAIPKDAIVLSRASERVLRGFKETKDGYIVPRWDLDIQIRSVLRDRLLSRVQEENQICRKLRCIRPCLEFTAYRNCHREGCPKHHGDAQYYEPASYNARVRIHFLQMLIYNTVDGGIEIFPVSINQKRFWLQRLHSTMLPPHPALGSLHALSPALPALMQGLQVTKSWIQDILYHLEPQRAEAQFLTQLAQTAQLAFSLDRSMASYCMRRVRCVTLFRPAELMRRVGDDKAYVVHDMLTFMENRDTRSLNLAFLFLNFVIDQCVPVDIATLCDLLDDVCACMIVAIRGQLAGMPRLNNVTLPKSWILRVMPHIYWLPWKQRNLSFLYLQRMVDLLERIHIGGNSAQHLFFEATDLSRTPTRIRNIFLLRILQNLCFWGYNINVSSLRAEIVKVVSSLQRPERLFSRNVQEYVTAGIWDQLARALRHSFSSRPPSDQVVQLHQGTLPNVASALSSIKHVAYQRPEEIPQLLNVHDLHIFDVVSAPVPTAVVSISVPAATSPTAPLIAPPPSEAKSLLPSVAAQPESAGVTIGQIGESDDRKDEQDVLVESAVDVDDIARAMDMKSEQDDIAEPKAPSEQESQAASVIAVAYQRYVARKSSEQGSKKTVFARRRLRVFAVFAKQSREMDWPNACYRLLFLGPVPHVFVVVEAMKNQLYEAKNAAKQKLNLVQHLELETVRSSLTQITTRFKTAHRLHDALDAASALHKARDVEKLKALTQEAEALMETFPTAISSEWKGDMAIAVKGIVAIRKLPKQEKPEIVTDDDFEVYE